MPPSGAIFRAAPMTRPLSPALLTRCEVIYSYVTRLTRETRASIEDYSELVVTYELGLVDSLRSGDFQLDGDGFHRMQRNGLKVRRWMNPMVSARPSIEAENALVMALRSEERRVGKECVSTCRSRWSPDK